MKPGDIIRVSMPTEVDLWWEVTAVWLGGDGEESVIALRPKGEEPNKYGATLVPVQILDRAIASGAVTHYAEVSDEVS